MRQGVLLALICLCRFTSQAATFGTAVPMTGGATDLVLDEARGRLYLVISSQNRIDVYSTAQKRFLSSIPVGAQPLSAALSRSGRYLYVTAYQSSTLEVVDLDSATVFKRLSLPAAPEGVAVGGDERVLISTVGSGTGNSENRLLLYNPNLSGEEALLAVPVTLPAPTTPQTPAPSSRVYMSTRSNLTSSLDCSLDHRTEQSQHQHPANVRLRSGLRLGAPEPDPVEHLECPVGFPQRREVHGGAEPV